MQSDAVSVNTASRLTDLLRIVTHPAFRLGALDAAAGRPLNHDDLENRLYRETPTSLKLSGLFQCKLELAQVRYEEGRHAVVAGRLKWRSWKHPDYPPKAVVEYCRKLALQRAGRSV